MVIPRRRTSNAARPEGRLASAAGHHLVFLPSREEPRFFLWGAASVASPLAARGVRAKALLVDEALALREVDGTSVPLLDALPLLAAMTTAEAERAPGSVAVWSLAAKLALDLVGRERLVPRIERTQGGTEARSAVALSLPEDAERVAALAKAFPPAAHAVPGSATARPPAGARRQAAGRDRAAKVEVLAAEALLRAFLDAAADWLVRAAVAAPGRGTKGRSGPADATRATRATRATQGTPATATKTRAKTTPGRKRETGAPWEGRLAAALTGTAPGFAPEGFQERTLLAELEAWARPALGAETGAPRACFRLDLPAAGQDATPGSGPAAGAFRLGFFLQAAEDRSLLVPASEVFRGRGQALRRLGQSLESAEEHLLRALARASRLFAPIERGLRDARPDGVALDASEAWRFLADGAQMLADSGMGVILPAELTRSGQRRLKLRMRVGAGGKGTAGVVGGGSALTLEEVMSFRWEVALAGETISVQDLLALARLKAPLVRFRGQWVAVDPAELAEARRLLTAGGGTLAGHEALAAALGATPLRATVELPIEVVAEGGLAAVLARLGESRSLAGAVRPPEFQGTLRPYQERGLSWLAQMSALGLGACLADDMGLGKTIQLLALLLHRRAHGSGSPQRALLVCPTSVIGNWEREAARFAPTLPVVRHYGPDRARSAREIAAGPASALVVTTYGLLRRDAAVLAGVDWSVAALDEAQNIKNAASHTARAARALRAGFRVALTGTPVENRLAELWSISEYLNPRLLGPLETFRREVAAPIERHGRDDVAESLRRLIGPFILRRLKSDPAIIQDLPPKQEMKVFCTLTREQASLYQAAVDEAMRRIGSAEGVKRRGLVLALITALKQICNHPAHYLGEAGPLAGRSGKLARLLEMLEEAVAAGDRALVFTQFREMGDRLVAELGRTLRVEVPFLHGGVSPAMRDAMVRRFQEADGGPRIFVLSLRAGGTGLNLTAASHVFHFDRWWNPAVEDQATDRAHRIGQRRTVQVHKLLCAGTVEEKVDQILEAKRDLAARIVSGGERWITELDDAALRELFSLAPDAALAADEAWDRGIAPKARRESRRNGPAPKARP
ncbi:MAG TPA: DEAD/DEAH box helicase [Thermoanaerobaculia bacterium]